jgi:hypothetical protein
MVLHGRGNQYFLTKEYEKLRQKGLLDRTKLDDTEKALADITTSGQGGGRTDPDKTYIFYNIPIPADRSDRKVDRRTVPRYGLGEGEE